ncbi:hypothetical protein [Streptomyces sp. SID8352]|uniref:hypothetical protein n=1 Tax=Streptomyces sp. SID8352 TaxID=2690338 RepID=UPI00136A3ABC|nr:hypothetical protein [Streptomyces sp. SID8352]MYU20770.1 hypothetical protein [Streptomyces sp. SID8352]
MTTTDKPLPTHGSRARYLRGCHCTPCRTANQRYCKQYRAKTIHQPVRIDATPVRERLQEWVNQGYSQSQITDATGKQSGDISKLLQGQRTIAPRVAARILRSPGPTGIPANARIDATGTIRRGRALHAIGYPIYLIAAGVPTAANHLGRLLEREPATVSAATAQGMTALYKRWIGRPGPSHFAIHDARRRGWHGPLAWDDIDNPDEQPDTDQTDELELKRHELAAIHRAEIEHLASFNLSTNEIARRLNLGISTVNAIVRELHGHERRPRNNTAA